MITEFKTTSVYNDLTIPIVLFNDLFKGFQQPFTPLRYSLIRRKDYDYLFLRQTPINNTLGNCPFSRIFAHADTFDFPNFDECAVLMMTYNVHY